MGVGAQWFTKLPLFVMYPLRGELLGKPPAWVEAWQLLDRKKPEQKVASGPRPHFPVRKPRVRAVKTAQVVRGRKGRELVALWAVLYGVHLPDSLR